MLLHLFEDLEEPHEAGDPQREDEEQDPRQGLAHLPHRSVSVRCIGLLVLLRNVTLLVAGLLVGTLLVAGLLVAGLLVAGLLGVPRLLVAALLVGTLLIPRLGVAGLLIAALLIPGLGVPRLLVAALLVSGRWRPRLLVARLFRLLLVSAGIRVVWVLLWRLSHDCSPC